MNKNSIIEQLESIINNCYLSHLQKKALQEVIDKYEPGMSNENLIELIKILGALLMMTHST